MEFRIYHNPRCRKSREALDLLRSKGIEPIVVEYLKEVPEAGEIKLLLAKLNMRPFDLVRKEEQVFKAHYRNSNFNDDEWIDILRENPKLIQRPIVVKGSKAVIGRPIDEVNKLLN